MKENIQDLIYQGQFTDPHRVLGLQMRKNQKQVIRLWRPGENRCELEVKGKKVEAKRVHVAGLYEYETLQKIQPSDYRIFHKSGKVAHDPYSCSLTFGDLDIHLMGRGVHYELYNLLGATIREHEGIKGTNFAVWAPNALSVSVVCDSNFWDGRVHPMRCIYSIGVWEIFIPGIGEGEKYKFEIITKEKERKIKADPVGHYTELRPKTASIVFDLNRFLWSDNLWMQTRGKFRQGQAPLNIYEVHLGSWRKKLYDFLNYREIAHQLAAYCKEMHFTHVELMGVCEHPLDESWGYQVTGYFAPTSRFGTPEDFQYLVNHLHENQIGVLIDWVPAHFPADDHGLYQFDGTCLYEHADSRKGYHPHWHTHIFNYGRAEVSNFLIASALFWCEKMHIDGLRVDAVASMLYLDYGRKEGEWIPNQYGNNINLEAVEFIKHTNSIVHQRFPEVILIAEESTSYADVTKESGLGFDFKWNLGWMNDTLTFFNQWFFDRGNDLRCITFPLLYAFHEKFILVLSHDEVVYGKKSLLSKMMGSDWEKFAGVRLLLSFMICMPGKKHLFMGGEIGQRDEWKCTEEIPWYLLQYAPHLQLKNMVGAINRFYQETPSFFELDFGWSSFAWVDFSDRENVIISYLRKGKNKNILCLHHFLSRTVENYRLYLKNVARIREVFNTDREEWGGSGKINTNIPILKGENGYVELSIPPLSTLIFDVEFEGESH